MLTHDIVCRGCSHCLLTAAVLSMLMLMPAHYTAAPCFSRQCFVQDLLSQLTVLCCSVVNVDAASPLPCFSCEHSLRYRVDDTSSNPTIPNQNNDIKTHSHQEQQHHHLLKNAGDKEMMLPRKSPSAASWENGDGQKMKATRRCHFLLHLRCCRSRLAAACRWSTLMGSFVSFVVIMGYLAMFKEFNKDMPSSTGWLLHFTTFPVSFTAVVVTAHSAAQMLIATVCRCTPLHWLLIAYDHFQCYAVGNADFNTKLAIFRQPLSLLTHNLTMLQTVLTMT